MQRYIQQLLEDINQATWNIKPPRDLWKYADINSELETEDMSFVEKYLYGHKEPVGVITSIDAIKLPPAEKLTEEQRDLLAGKLEELLKNFHFALDFPDSFPAHLRYAFIKNFWSEEHVALSFGIDQIELCDFEEDNCPFPGYCNTCKEIKEQLKYDEKIEKRNSQDGGGDIELPF